MKFKKLGNTDLDVSLICLGTMTYGEQNTQDQGFEQMDYAVEKGINFFDTAELYAIPPKEKTYGKTEEIIGNWFKKRNNRKEIILASVISILALLVRPTFDLLNPALIVFFVGWIELGLILVQ